MKMFNNNMKTVYLVRKLNNFKPYLLYKILLIITFLFLKR